VTPFTEMTLDGMNCSELVVFLMWGFVFYPIEVTPIFEKIRGSNQPHWERDGCMHNSWEYDNPMGYSTWYGPYECVWKGWFTPDLWQGLGSLNWNPRGWFNHTAKTFQETLTQLNALYWTKQTEEKKTWRICENPVGHLGIPLPTSALSSSEMLPSPPGAPGHDHLAAPPSLGSLCSNHGLLQPESPRWMKVIQPAIFWKFGSNGYL
jgi:hypothetical protein